MNASTLNATKSSIGSRLPLGMRVFFVGLWRDFWKDAPLTFFAAYMARVKAARAARALKAKEEKVLKSVKAAAKKKETKKEAEPKDKIWVGDRIQILERMWGEGHAFPGGDLYIDMLITPLGLTKEMSILDLSARLGSMARKIAQDFGAYVTGMEADPALVSRGMILSIAAGKGKQATVEAYNPETFDTKRKYDCVFARELFYKIKDKERMFKQISEAVKKGGGQIVFTDFLVDSVSRKKSAIVDWAAKEGKATPMTLPEVIKTWKGLGFDLRVAEDQTDIYKQQILSGVSNLLEAVMESAPDKRTKLNLLIELDFWASRLNAIKRGLKYYRFYGIRY